MLPKGMGYQVGHEVSEPERGIYQPLKKREKEKGKGINQQSGMTPKSTSINLKYAGE